MPIELKSFLAKIISDFQSTDTQIALFVILLVISIIVIDGINIAIRKKKKASGITEKTSKIISIDGFKTLPSREYISEIQGLAGRPDALVMEQGMIIPVEHKPLAKKIRDRYVAQLLVYMRLIEEFEGRKPPYGYLILGANCRRVKIFNTQEKQNWLQKMIDEMQAIAQGKLEATPLPHVRKCRKCGVRGACEFRAG